MTGRELVDERFDAALDKSYEDYFSKVFGVMILGLKTDPEEAVRRFDNAISRLEQGYREALKLKEQYREGNRKNSTAGKEGR